MKINIMNWGKSGWITLIQESKVGFPNKKTPDTIWERINESTNIKNDKIIKPVDLWILCFGVTIESGTNEYAPQR